MVDNQPLSVNQIINPAVFIPPLEPVCYPEADIGCFPPWDLSRYISLPVKSVRPETPDSMGIQFYLLSRSSPDRLTQNLSGITCGSKVAFVIHGYLERSTDQPILLLADVLSKTFDHVILVDWRYPADPVVAFGIPIPAANFFVMQANVQVVGRITANLIAKKLIVDPQAPCINPDDIRVVGFSAGGNMLYFIASWLQERYNITLGHLVGLDPSGPPYYFSSNFEDKQIKPGLAKAVDMVQCTFNFEIPIITELQALALRFGSFGASGDTKYLVNLPDSYIDQPGCFGIPACSHFYCLMVYTASLFPDCGFNYKPCNYLGTTTYLPNTTHIDSRAEGAKGLICIKASENPLRDCTIKSKKSLIKNN